MNRLFDLLFEIRDQYNETLLKKWSGLFRLVFQINGAFCIASIVFVQLPSFFDRLVILEEFINSVLFMNFGLD